jgi:hypothetical protein
MSFTPEERELFDTIIRPLLAATERPDPEGPSERVQEISEAVVDELEWREAHGDAEAANMLEAAIREGIRIMYQQVRDDLYPGQDRLTLSEEQRQAVRAEVERRFGGPPTPPSTPAN